MQTSSGQRLLTHVKDETASFLYLIRMARYFMNLHDCGALIADEEGIDLPGAMEARRAAIQAARDVMCGDVANGILCLASYIDVVNEHGTSIAVVPFREAVTVTG